jgi:uncharacterized repeat protein (TIGR02543 family)
MKKTLSLFLALLLMVTLTVPALAADVTITYSLTSDGKNAITVPAGTTIQVLYTQAANGSSTPVSVAQNEITYDESFFELVEGSNQVKKTSYTTTVLRRQDGNNYVYFNTMNNYTLGTGAAEIGTFQLKVKAGATGSSTVTSKNCIARGSGSAYSITTNDLKVTVGTVQTPRVNVTYSSAGSTDTQSVLQGTTITLGEPTREGYIFKGWQLGDTTYAAGATYKVESAVTFTALWAPDVSGGTGVISGTTTAMEYRASSSTGAWTTCTAVSTQVSAGSYDVRVKGSTSASEITTVTVAAATLSDNDNQEVDIGGSGNPSSGGGSGLSGGTTDNNTGDNNTGGGTTENPFTDVAPNSYYYNAVLWAVKNGITTGTSATTFDPDMICTRAQAVTFLWRVSGSPDPVSTDMPYTDVAADAYYHDAVMWAVENGITKGTSETTFSPDMTCTRAHIATFLWRMQNEASATEDIPFIDVSADAYYAAAVQWAAENEITNGTSETTFSPHISCSRAQIVTFLYRMAGTTDQGE